MPLLLPVNGAFHYLLGGNVVMDQAWLHALVLHPSASAQHYPHRDRTVSKSEMFLRDREDINIVKLHGGVV